MVRDRVWWGNWCEVFRFLVESFVGGLKIGAEVVGVAFFGWQKSSLCVSW